MTGPGDPFGQRLTSEAELRALVGEPSELVRRKVLTRLDHHCRAFIARSPMVLVGTASAEGRCDVSPRGDAPGFVLVLDDAHLVIPDRPGNRRVDSFRNLLENPHVGLLFVIPGLGETLRVNGRGCVVRDEALLDRMAVAGRRPLLGIGVAVEEAYLHCAKAFRRSRLWEPAQWPDRSGMASIAQMLLDHARPAGTSVEDLERVLAESYEKRLY